MRSILIAGGLVVCLAVALAAGVGVQPVPRTSPELPTVLSPRRVLSAAERANLGRGISRAEQLQALQSNPTTNQLLQKLGAGAVPRPNTNDPWCAGITLTPLEAVYPPSGYPSAAHSSSAEILVDLYSEWASMDGRDAPLPQVGQDPQLLSLAVFSASDGLFYVRAQWPQPGAYLVSFVMAWQDPLQAAALPRVYGGQGGLQPTPVPNPPTAGAGWTVLLDLASDAGWVCVYPPYSGHPNACWLSKVVIRRLN